MAPLPRVSREVLQWCSLLTTHRKNLAARSPVVPLTALIPRSQLAIYSRGQRKVYAFDRVFDCSAGQAQVYEDTKPLIRSVLDGRQPQLRLTHKPQQCCPAC